MYMKENVRNVTAGDMIFNHGINVKSTHYLPEPFLRKGHATKKPSFVGVDKKKSVQKSDAGEPE